MFQSGQRREVLSLNTRCLKGITIEVQLNSARRNACRNGLKSTPRAVDDVTESITEARAWTRWRFHTVYHEHHQCYQSRCWPWTAHDDFESRVCLCEHGANYNNNHSCYGTSDDEVMTVMTRESTAECAVRCDAVWDARLLLLLLLLLLLRKYSMCATAVTSEAGMVASLIRKIVQYLSL